MKRIGFQLVLTVVLTMVLASLSGASAAVITAGLEVQMKDLRGSDEIKVLVVLRDGADIRSLNWQLHDSRATRNERHQAVLGALQAAADRSQAALISDLQASTADGQVRGFRPHWLINAVVVVGTVDAVRELAKRDDVLAIEADLPYQLIAPVTEQEVRDDELRGVGLAPGIAAINAPRVWNELGIDGSGVVVGIIDTGVDGNHPALGDRWRGHFADPSACWLDLIGANPSFPTDTHSHGTHVMGTITGLADGDTIGVAPGALWIATNPINQNVGDELDSDVLVSLEWLADPDGNPETSDDVPCVVQNSWGVHDGMTGYPDCFSLWWDAIDNCEAAGVCLTWSAGNEGPGGETLRSPGNRVADDYNCFSIGSTLHFPPYEISWFSSRGPSSCDGDEAIKPEVSAPGSDIYSSVPGGYGYKSGTSMAGPHVAGVVALMCAANPDLDVISIKQTLMDTAIDLGPEGEDNVYGHGFVDAYEAVVAVLDGMGTVSGTISDSETGLPLAGVQVSVPDRQIIEMSDGEGQYRVHLPEGEHTITFALFGFEDAILEVSVGEDETVDGSIALIPTPRAVISGRIYDSEDALVVGARIWFLDTPLAPAFSDAEGAYVIEAPVGEVYRIAASGNGLGADLQIVDLQGAMELDFLLPELGPEDFELGAFVSYPWAMVGDVDWVIDDEVPYEGQFCAKTGELINNQSSELDLVVNVAEAGEITFRYKVSSEPNYDYFYFFVDGEQILRRSGVVNWRSLSHQLSLGQHTLTWAYRKDAAGSSFADACWIDLIEFPPLAAVAYPSLTIEPTAIELNLEPGETAELPLSIGNVGTGELDYLFSVHYPGDPEPFVGKDEGDKRAAGADDPRDLSGGAPVAGFGGPDSFGYSWIDSDEPGGPVFDWVDVSGLGQIISLMGNGNYGPFDLGIVFRFYGHSQTKVRICTNGYLSFTSDVPGTFNWPIPQVDQPNNVIAPFWDGMEIEAGAPVYYYADPEIDRFVVQWQEVEHFPYGNPETFQVILNADGTILYQYLAIDIDDGCTVGIENQYGTDGLEVIHDAGGYLHDGLAILLTPPAEMNWLHVSPQIGTVAAQGMDEVSVSVDASELATGVYTAELRLVTNDPQNPEVTLPVILTLGNVVGVAADLPSAVSFSGAAPNPFNPLTTLRYSLPRDAFVQLKLYDAAGRLVRSLVNEQRPAGAGAVVWNGADESGRRAASGTYFARLVVDGQTAVKPLTLVR